MKKFNLQYIQESTKNAPISKIEEEIVKEAKLGNNNIILDYFLNDKAKQYFVDEGFDVYEDYQWGNKSNPYTTISW